MPDKCISGQMTVDSLLQLFKPSFYLVGVDGTDGMDCIEGVGLFFVCRIDFELVGPH